MIIMFYLGYLLFMFTSFMIGYIKLGWSTLAIYFDMFYVV